MINPNYERPTLVRDVSDPKDIKRAVAALLVVLGLFTWKHLVSQDKIAMHAKSVAAQNLSPRCQELKAKKFQTEYDKREIAETCKVKAKDLASN